MESKKLLLAIVVIAIIVIAGAFIYMTYFKGSSDNTTGQLTEVPEPETDEAAETGVDSGKFSEITEGMSTDDVIALVGEPTDKQATTTAKGHAIVYWYYTDSNDDVWQVGISNDEVQVVRKY